MSKFERDRYSNYRSLVFPFSPQSLRNSKIFLEVISSYESRFILRFLKIISSRLKHLCIKASFHLSSRKWYQNSKFEAILLYESRYNHLFAIKTSVHQSIIPFIPKEHHKISKFARNGIRAATIFKNNLFAIKTSVHQSIMISKFEIRSYALVRISMQFLKIICSRWKSVHQSIIPFIPKKHDVKIRSYLPESSRKEGDPFRWKGNNCTQLNRVIRATSDAHLRPGSNSARNRASLVIVYLIRGLI